MTSSLASLPGALYCNDFLSFDESEQLADFFAFYYLPEKQQVSMIEMSNSTQTNENEHLYIENATVTPHVRESISSPLSLSSCERKEHTPEELNQMKKKRKLWGITGYSGPTLIIYGKCGAIGAKVVDTMPPTLRSLVIRVCEKFSVPLPFQVTINYYANHKRELIPHKDGVGQRVIILSLGKSSKMFLFTFISFFIISPWINLPLSYLNQFLQVRILSFNLGTTQQTQHNTLESSQT
jgi:hypothetical protein